MNSPREAETIKERINNEIVINTLGRQERKERGLLEMEVLTKVEKSTNYQKKKNIRAHRADEKEIIGRENG